MPSAATAAAASRACCSPAPAKLTLATLGKEAFEDRTIRIPQGDAPLRADLHKLKKLTGPTGAPRFVAESDADGHADRTWALLPGPQRRRRPERPGLRRQPAAPRARQSARVLNAMKLSDHIAQRGRSIDFTALGFNLPNPDPILRARGGRIELYRELRTDAHVGGCIRRRKSAVKSLEWGLDRDKARSRWPRKSRRCSPTSTSSA